MCHRKTCFKGRQTLHTLNDAQQSVLSAGADLCPGGQGSALLNQIRD